MLRARIGTGYLDRACLTAIFEPLQEISLDEQRHKPLQFPIAPATQAATNHAVRVSEVAPLCMAGPKLCDRAHSSPPHVGIWILLICASWRGKQAACLLRKLIGK
jgi:hypothetical protein